MKFAFISNSASPGILIFRRTLISTLVKLGHEVVCFIPDLDNNLNKKINELGATTVQYELDRSSLNIFSSIKTIFSLKNKLKKNSPDIILSFFMKPSFYGTVSGWLAGVPVRIALLEGLGYIYTDSLQYRFNKKKLLRLIHRPMALITSLLASRILFLNNDDPLDFFGFFYPVISNYDVIGPIGLELDKVYDEIEETKPEKIKFLFVGRLLIEKGILEFIKAAEIVKRTCPQAKFIVVGDFDYKNPSAVNKKHIIEAIDKKTIDYEGYQVDVMSFYRSSDIFVLPSYREGFPRSTQEAMACGCAVITTDVPGCRETVIDHQNGILVRPYDEHELAKAMIYLINNKKYLKKMKKSSQEIAYKKFDSVKIDKNMIELFETLTK